MIGLSLLSALFMVNSKGGSLSRFNLTAPERETVISWDDEDKAPRIHTSQRTMITQLLRNPSFTEESRTEESGRVILLSGILAEGAITVRNKAKGSIRRSGGTRKGMPSNAARCGKPTASGTACKSLASKATGKCAKHSRKDS